MTDWSARKKELVSTWFYQRHSSFNAMIDDIIRQEQAMIEELEALKRISIDKISQKIKVEEKLKGWGYTEKIKGYKEIIKILENKE